MRLLTGTRNGEEVTLTWREEPRFAGIAAALLMHEQAEVTYLGPSDTQNDPLGRLEEEMSGEAVAKRATEVARSDQEVAASVLLRLMENGAVSITADQLWALIGATNGAYVRLRNADLDAQGVESEIGAPGDIDVDGSLAAMLGETPVAHDNGYWSMESALFAELTDCAMDIAQG